MRGSQYWQYRITCYEQFFLPPISRVFADLWVQFPAEVWVTDNSQLASYAPLRLIGITFRLSQVTLKLSQQTLKLSQQTQRLFKWVKICLPEPISRCFAPHRLPEKTHLRLRAGASVGAMCVRRREKQRSTWHTTEFSNSLLERYHGGNCQKIRVFQP